MARQRMNKELVRLAEEAWDNGAQNCWDTGGELGESRSYTANETLDNARYTTAWESIIRMDAEDICEKYLLRAHPGGC